MNINNLTVFTLNIHNPKQTRPTNLHNAKAYY